MAPKASSTTAPKKMTGLPIQVASPTDVGRLLRELEAIDESLRQLGLRAAGSEVKLPKTSQLMDKVVELNKLNLLQANDRALLQRSLQVIKKRAPVLHMSFSTDPSVLFMEKLVTWLRQEIHPLVLLTIGLQPNIGAGCVVRTTNRQFDFSLRQNFADKRELLMGKLQAKESQA